MTKTQLSPPDQVFVNVSDSPHQPKNFKDSIGGIRDLLSEGQALEKSKNRKILLSILFNSRYLLVRQPGFAIKRRRLEH